MKKLSFQTVKQEIQPSLPFYKKKVAQTLYKAYAGLVALKEATPCVQDSNFKRHLKGNLRPYQSERDFKTSYRALEKKHHPDHHRECSELQGVRVKKIKEHYDSMKSQGISKVLEKTPLWYLIKSVYLGLDVDFKAGDSYQTIVEKYDITAADHMFGDKKWEYKQQLLEEIKSNMASKGCVVSAPDQPTASEIKDCLKQYPDLEKSAKVTVERQINDNYNALLDNQLGDIVLAGRDKVTLLQEEYNKVHAAGLRSYCNEHGGLCKILGENGIVKTDNFQNYILGELLPEGDVGIN